MGYMRTPDKQTTASMPNDFIVINAGQDWAGDAVAIKVWRADFPDDTTSIKINNTGKNLSNINNAWLDGDILHAHFTSIKMPAVTDMKILIYVFSG